ncbi:MAG TPA: hypothetical protein VMT18_07645, partial [Planctomycetota bacterium]|nr:hypothetical protein [Planctomycetota bacterium]
GLLRVDLRDGDRSLVSSATGIGVGPPLRQGTGLMLDTSTDARRAIVCDRGREALLAIDLAPGDRALVSGEGVGAGPPFQAEEWFGIHGDFHIDGGHGSAWVADQGGGLMAYRLLHVDLASGDRSVVSGPGVGGGPPLMRYSAMTVDEVGQRAFLAQIEPRRVLEVDLATGDRRELSGPSNGAGPLFPTYGYGIDWDDVAGRVVWTGYTGEVIGVDAVSGDRESLAQLDPSQGPGPLLTRSATLVRPGPGVEPVLMFFDISLHALVALDLSRDPISGTVAGQRTFVSR